ncbi:MAG: hypothetical protein CMH64_04525 [Nanoarchaeota archaeon]|nr:hypothetical protein [Nanoarchaeota archaeon]|tara:strand:- start:6011 stop:6694 length:684 start_codon:yes stop_codon:yes gene_type:complete
MRTFGIIFALLILVFSVSAIDFDLSKQDSGIVSGLEGKVLILTVDGSEEIKMTLDVVGSTRIQASLEPINKVLVLDIGQEQRIDLDKDGEDDVKISLNNIIDKLASFKLESLNIEEEVVEDEIVIEEGEEIVIEEEVETQIDFSNDLTNRLNSYSRWVIGAVVLVVIVILIFVFRSPKDPDKFYSKAMDLHREGQEFHWDGDDETAEELYDKASELREKARDLEGGF